MPKVSRKHELKEEARVERKRKRSLVVQSAIIGSVLWLFGSFLIFVVLGSTLWLYVTTIVVLALAVYPATYYMGKHMDQNARHNKSGAAPLVDGGGVNALYVQGNWLDRWEKEKEKNKAPTKEK